MNDPSVRLSFRRVNCDKTKASNENSLIITNTKPTKFSNDPKVNTVRCP